MALVAGGFGSCPAHAETMIDKIGHRWDESELGWKGVWTRRDITGARSNIFDAYWTKPGLPSHTAELRISVSVRNEVIIMRYDKTGVQAGGSCRYTGWLQGTYASGTVSCSWSPGPHQWSARIWK